MNNFEYKGVSIALTDHGEFKATVNGKFTMKPSLDAMKKHIDKIALSDFTPFSALIRETWKAKGDKDGLVRVQVIGVEKQRTKTYGPTHKFIVEGGESVSAVMVDSDKNRAAYVKAQQYKEETGAIETERCNEQVRLDKAVQWKEAGK